MKLDPGMHIVMHLVFFGKSGVTLRHAAEGGHDVAAYLYTFLLYRDNGSDPADDNAKRYMRPVTSGGSMTSRWLSNEGCLPLREKAARATLLDLAHLG
jgi:hypothetical protein